MRVLAAGLAVMFGVAAAPSDQDIALNNVPAALDGAETALAQCPQMEIAIPVRAAINAARTYIIVARTNSGAMDLLNTELHAIKQGLNTCLQFKKLNDDYHAKCQGDARLGMTKEDVRHTAWCAPSKVMATETTGHTREEWIYTDARQQSWMGRPAGFLYFTDGKLTSIEREAGTGGSGPK